MGLSRHRLDFCHEPRRLSWGQRLAGWLALALFVVTFVPVPITVRSVALGLPSSPDSIQKQPHGDDPYGPEPADGFRPAEEFKL